MNSKTAMVRTLDESDAFDRGNGVVTRLFRNEGNCGAEVATATTILPVGRSDAMHHHNCDEQIVILSGRAEAEFEGQRRPIGPMEVAYIPQVEAHCLHKVGEGPVVMLFIYDSGEVTRTFEATGETVVHLAAGDRAQPKG